MSVQTKREVPIEEAQRALSDGLGPGYRVTVGSRSILKVGRTGVIPAHVKVTHSDGITTFTAGTTGLIVSRIVQAISINPRVRRVLEEAYSEKPAAG
jgi:hypothetical protein